MRKYPIFILSLMLIVIFACSALAESSGSTAVRPTMQVIACPEQGFSTRCSASYDWQFREDLGVTIQMPIDQGSKWVRICRLMVDPDFSTEDYFQGTIAPEIHDLTLSYFQSEEALQWYPLGSKQLLGQAFHYTTSQPYTRVVLIARQGSDVVRYDINYPDGKEDFIWQTLQTVWENYQPDPDYYARGGVGLPAPRDDLTTYVSDLGFSVLVDPRYTVEESEASVTIYTQIEGSIPYVIIVPSEDRIMDAEAFIHEQITPHVMEQYGDDLIDYKEYASYSVGGKSLPTAIYTYRLQGYTVHMLRIVDSTSRRTVAYTAKYLDGEGEATLACLDRVIASFQDVP